MFRNVTPFPNDVSSRTNARGVCFVTNIRVAALWVSDSAFESRARVSSLRYRVFGLASPRVVGVKAEKKKLQTGKEKEPKIMSG